ncbi:unnamed protein product [Colias eurytheme]|nr:unnamed protein product [Colias eurytheme]
MSRLTTSGAKVPDVALTLSVRAKKSSCSVCVTKVRESAGASACTPGGGGRLSKRSMRSAGTRGSCRPVVFGAWEKPSFANRLSRITLRLCSRAFSYERQEAQTTWAAGGSCGQARSAATAANHAASSSRLAGLARGPRDAPSGRVVRQSGERRGRHGGASERCAAADGACYTARGSRLACRPRCAHASPGSPSERLASPRALSPHHSPARKL